MIPIPETVLPTTAAYANTPVAPRLCNAENVLPTATLPIDDCIAAAVEPPTIPALPNPIKYGIDITTPVPIKIVPPTESIFEFEEFSMICLGFSSNFLIFSNRFI